MSEGTPAPPPDEPTTTPSTADRLRDPSRVAALTDGVFAIVLTILVLEVAVPPNLSQTSLRRVVE
jgi:uncharacterized membrane protein